MCAHVDGPIKFPFPLYIWNSNTEIGYTHTHTHTRPAHGVQKESVIRTQGTVYLPFLIVNMAPTRFYILFLCRPVGRSPSHCNMVWMNGHRTKRTSAFRFVAYLRFVSVSSFRRNGKIKLIHWMVETKRRSQLHIYTRTRMREQTCKLILARRHMHETTA